MSKLRHATPVPSHHPAAGPDPFSPQGLMQGDKMLPPRRAERVLIDDLDIITALGGGGPWRDGRIDYGAVRKGHLQYLDVEEAFARVVGLLRGIAGRLTETERTLQSVVSLAKATTHGAVREGLQLSIIPGTRTLQMEGGRVVVFQKGASGEYQAGTLPVMAHLPLRFRVVSNGSLVQSEDHLDTDVPADLCAGTRPGQILPQASGTLRVDVLGVVPDGDAGVEWYLLLGGRSAATAVDEAAAVPSPAIPGVDGVGLLPLYRIVSRAGDPGLLQVVQVANRVNGV